MTTSSKLPYVLALLAVLGLSLTLTACNTIEGAGEDASAAGRAVSGAAEDTKEAL
jgi:predicted small secreted protein